MYNPVNSQQSLTLQPGYTHLDRQCCACEFVDARSQLSILAGLATRSTGRHCFGYFCLDENEWGDRPFG
ncbi:hypothetical protein IQ270_23505 [Microcoleus sp. LEGE 07076]|uniref:hypothetical protein n=1 Tax=Microcoleus sp. LEGE 07076 TaxID=915322 RepID=UPI001882627E|nr:hypothetical protein [Microcoleus sp. LEGE 07076]MBE9187531.1 hypothetical protein [Microcoleus sp. LEGE 07076]